MSGDECKVKVLNGVIVQENGIIRNSRGYLIGRISDEIGFESDHLKDPPKRISFRKNYISYGLDHGFHRGIPTGVEFEVIDEGDNRYELIAPGYGEVGNYGSGSLHVYGLTRRQQKKFRDAAQPRVNKPF